MKLKFLLLTLFVALTTQAQNHFSFDFEEVSGTLTALDSVSNSSYAISNHYGAPERVAGVQGNALRLDGFSTFLNLGSNNLDSVSKELSLSLWYATEAFTQDGGALVSKKASTSGFELKVSPFGILQFNFHTDNNQFTLESSNPISRYNWYKIGVDLDLNSGKAKLLLNGTTIDSLNVPTTDNLVFPSNTSLIIGRSSQNQTTYGFSTVTVNGLIDAVKIQNESKFDNFYTIPQGISFNARPALYINPSIRHGSDHLRPQYHPMPNTSWTNESYGLTYYKGQYHMFFQKNPNAPALFFMHWGHLVSSDLVHWKEVEMSLAPSPGWDDWGIWSGTTAFDTSGTPIIFYTGVDGQKAGIGRAYATDSTLINWEKDNSNPLISNPPSSYNHMDFRDPYIFEQNGIYYMIIGSGLAGNGGGILFSYKSTDMENWNFMLPIFQHNKVSELGTFWEMAHMFEIKQDTFLLGVGPLGMPRVRALYSLGTFANNKFVPFFDESEFKDIELIEHNLLAPSFGKDEWGEYVYSGILADQRSVTDQVAAGWRHTFSLPRRVFVCDDGKTLGQYPHPNLCSLRDTLNTMGLSYSLTNGQNTIVQNWSSQQYEFEGYVTNASNSFMTLEFLKDTVSNRSAKVELDFVNDRVFLNRQTSSPYISTQDRQGADYIFADNDSVYLRVFIDHSIIEVFIDDIAVMSARVYPHPNQNQVSFKCLSGSANVTGNLYPLHNMLDSNNLYTKYCDPLNLPTGLNGYISVNEDEEEKLLLHPNPSTETISINTSHFIGSPFKLTDTTGKLHLDGVYNQPISIQHLPLGSYYLQFPEKNRTFKFIKT